MKKTLILTLIVCIQQFFARCEELDIEALASGDQNQIYTTHSESTRPIHVPVFEKIPVQVPHPVPYAVPQYIKVPIPQPYPKYTKVQHPIQVPVYKVVPEIIEKPSPYTVEKPYPIEVEKPFPVEVVKKFEVPVPRPYPVHMIYYKHISEDEPAQKVIAKQNLNYNQQQILQNSNYSQQQLQISNYNQQQLMQYLQQLKQHQLKQQQQKKYKFQLQHIKSRVSEGKVNEKRTADKPKGKTQNIQKRLAKKPKTRN